MDYNSLLSQFSALIENEDDSISLYANTSAFVAEFFKNINWVGFYIAKHDYLSLGPFQGKIACNKIQFTKGVCGHAFSHDKTTCVEDVHQFPGHIACDASSLSELVIPVHHNNNIIAVLDIDSQIYSRFSADDIRWFEEIVKILEYQLNTFLPKEV